MYVTAAAALLRGLASTRTSLSHQTIDEYHWMQPTLTDLEVRLDPSRFCRISRAAVVNLDAVEEVIPLEGGSGRARLINGRSLEISRRRLQALMDRLSET